MEAGAQQPSSLPNDRRAALVARLRSLGSAVEEEGIAVVTIQRNFGTEFTSLVVDLGTGELFANYGQQVARYDDLRTPDTRFNACVAWPLQRAFAFRGAAEGGEAHVGAEETDCFCCSEGLMPYKARHQGQNEAAFQQFFTKQGTVGSVVFEVKTQVNNGPLLRTRWYALDNGRRVMVPGPYTHKVHAFKNFVCRTHNRFYGVDMYRRDGAGTNSHHMRIVPFTHRNNAVLDEFVQ